MAEPINELSGGPGDLPLFMRAMQNPLIENMPGIGTTMGIMHGRGMNTIMRGGFMDDRKRLGPGKLGGFAQGSMTPTSPTSNAFYGTSSRRAKMTSLTGQEAKMPYAKGARVNHITGRPRALGRYSSLTVMEAAEHPSFYSPFHFSKGILGKQLAKNEGFRKLAYGGAEFDAITGKGKEPILQRGMISMIGAGRKADILERKIAGGSSKAAGKLATAQQQVGRLANMNNPINPVGGKALEFGRVVKRSEMAANGGKMISMNASSGLGSTGVTSALAGGTQVGLTGNLMASAGARPGSRAAMGYFRGALGHAGAGGLTGEALTGANRAIAHLSDALGGNKMRVAGRALEGSVFKTLGLTNTLKAAGTKKGAMVLGARTAAMALPGINLLATAALVYDLGKMGGALVKSGVNLAKDAVKSMKGSIDKPGFGMGYKDNEVAATSRARGVAAIQNSRLNARSALGNEGSMMAAHFG